MKRATAGGMALVAAWAGTLPAAPPDPAAIEFFEKKIRPIFVEHCYKCHSRDAEKVKGGLLLDTREGLLKGGDTGAAIVPGSPEKSLLIKAVHYTDENLQMPPKGEKLSEEQIGDLEAWVKMGAPDPRTGKAAAGGPPLSDPAKVRTHWAFQPIRQPLVPVVRNKRWVQTPVDAFVLAKLEAKGMAPSTRSDRRTFVRRASFDIRGLPPTPEEVETFVADRSLDAYEKLADRLLASPRYGERWGRYWLDVARYADTKGYVFEEERRFPYAYTYRDYVIRALNQDLPFDRFIIEQLAADLLDLGEDKRPLAALGYLTLGRRFLNNQPDIIDDRIDVVTRGLMGLTVGCARCHDHKYDPIPTKDYYSLYGVFASCSEPNEKPLLGKTALPKEYPEYIAEREKREADLKAFRETKEGEARAKLRSQVGEYLLVVADAAKKKDEDKLEALARERKLDPGVARRWKGALAEWGKSPHPIFAPWIALAELPEQDFAAKVKALAAQFAANQSTSELLNPLVSRAFEGEAPKSLKEAAERYSKLFGDADKASPETLEARAKPEAGSSRSSAAEPAAPAERGHEALRQVLYADGAPPNPPSDELRRLLDTPTQQKLRALRRKVDETDVTHPGAPPRAMALVDNGSPYTPHVFIRGNANNQGAEVPRQFLEVLTGDSRKPFQQGSGRLELARAIASPANPLTARVIVNRVWLHHFGTGLVRTPSDFGVRSDPPTHPELLDYLASRFMREGWSLKQLHRLILLSSTYRQSAEDSPKYARLDPANQLLWKMNRQRLDFEAMRDTFLAVSGNIEFAGGGRPMDLTTEPFAQRRTVYGFVERQNLPGLFRTFDFANPDSTSPQRFTTTVPQQALFLMNSPFVVQQAKNMIERPEIHALRSDEQRIQQLYRIAFQRAPTPDEIKLAQQFIHARDAAASVPTAPWVWQYGWGELDGATKRVKRFEALPHFNGYAWQGSTNLPDAQLGWVLLNADGGHPGNDLQHAAIRRWRAPRDGVMAISGELQHLSDQGDGVRASIISSRQGELGQWTAMHEKVVVAVARVAVKRGDTIDFVTDCRGSVDYDSFTWSPTIKSVAGTGHAGSEPLPEWSAKADFSGPPKEKPKSLGSWEQFAQVLLLANELMFVD